MLKNTAKVQGLTRSGKAINVIPDAITDAGIYEFKNRLFISSTRQLQAQINYAVNAGKPFNLVVSPRTQYVSLPLKEAVESTGGTISVLDTATGALTPFF
ncbi:MAG: hypothetical protein HC927_12735 [Deltaproteobacteria bacterium]|nr:hypothetical protein [Deltaproteobacteria bacterium]